MCLLSHAAPHPNFSITCERSVEFQLEIKIICRCGFCSQTTQIVVISRCCFTYDDWEMYKVLKRMYWAIVLPIRSFVFPCLRRRRHRGPDALGKFLFMLRKNLSPVPWEKCAWWFLELPNFVKAYQTSETLSSCFGAGQILWQICQLTRLDLKENIH